MSYSAQERKKIQKQEEKEKKEKEKAEKKKKELEEKERKKKEKELEKQRKQAQRNLKINSENFTNKPGPQQYQSEKLCEIGNKNNIEDDLPSDD